MKKAMVTILILSVLPNVYAQQNRYDSFFIGKTMRVDYYHTGNADEEYYSLDQVYQAQQWAGSRINLIDTLNLGKYLFKVYDVATNQLLYSRGFASIFGEWQTTGEAIEGTMRTFHETIRFPFPKRSVQINIAKRDEYMHFHDQFSVVIDPNSRFVNHEVRSPLLKLNTVFENGAVQKKVDLLIVGDGYTVNELKKFRNDANHFVDVLFSTSPFKEHKKDFNVRTLEVISQESGIDEPRKNIWKNTALGCSYNSMDSPRYVLTYANKEIRDLTSSAPYDFLFILLNSNRYGGGGIFNLYATSMTGANVPGMEWQVDYVSVHEFGHCIAGLADEYYSSSVAYSDFYPPGVEPWEPNVTALVGNNLKWKQIVEPATPIPTPWDKADYDSLGRELGKLNRDESAEYYEKRDEIFAQQEDLLHRQKYWGKVGAFEGAGYSSKGLYRPYLDCRMFSLSLADFCPVCRAAIERVIDFYSK